jgi:hypothetical protein
MTDLTADERSLLNQLLLRARETDDAEAFDALAGYAADPDAFRAALAAFQADGPKTEDRAGGKVKKTGTDKTGRKYTRLVNPAGSTGGGADGDPATPDHDPQTATAAAGQLQGLPDAVTKNPGLMAKLGDALLTAAAKVHLKLTAMTPAMLKAADVLGGVFDTPDDLKKFGYAPTMSAGTASADSSASADPMRAHVGISTHLACTIASHVLAKAVVWASKKKGGMTEAEDDGLAGWADLVAEVFAAVNAALGTEGAPDAAEIEKALRELLTRGQA